MNMTSLQRAGDPGARPTLEELRQDTREARQMDLAEGDAVAAAEAKQGKVNKFGWCAGVYIPCLLNIWGVMLFLRLTWVVGQAGILEGLAILVLSNVVTAITTISMSAVSTNGLVKGGGIYYMISRSLGPEFGGSIGLMFTVANSVAVSMYIIGFCESLLDMIYQFAPDFNGIISNIRIHDVRLIGSVSLVCILALAIVGMEWVTRVQKILLVLLIFSQLDFIIGTFIPPSAEEHAKGFVGWNAKLASTNLWSDYRPDGEGTTPTFFKVFSVFFPAVTGIVAGANLSGDLKDPSYSIPKGTFAAIGSTFVTYFIYFIMVGCVSVKYASGRVEELGFGDPGYNVTAYAINNVTHAFDDCLDRTCDYGSAVNQQMMEVMSVWGPLIYAGCFAATLSSAIASLVGAPRVLQALAKDRLYPCIEVFAAGWGANNDPIRGYIFVFAISLICILIADLNVVSGLLSNFFVATYALINFSVFHASITKSPGWRPSFKYYNQWVSLLGTLLCVVVMFLMDHITALITFICIICLYICVSVRKPDANWGSSTQAQAFVTALKASQNLSRVSEHVKNYRPKLLLLSGPPSSRPSLVHFANLITKRISLLSTTHVVKDPDIDWTEVDALRTSAQDWCLGNKVKAFHAVTRNTSFTGGVRAAIELQGLGKLAPNMVMLGFKDDWREEVEEAEEYFLAITTALDMHLSVGLLRVQGGFDISGRDEPTHFSVSSTPSLSPSNETAPVSKATSVMALSVDSGLNVSSTPDLRSRQNSRVHDLEEEQPNQGRVFLDKNPLRDTVDIYWLYDDGGLTLLLPHILHTRQKFSHCKVRVFFLCSKKEELDNETRAMVSLLTKFRIEADDVIIIPDATRLPREDTKDMFERLVLAPGQRKKLSTASSSSEASNTSFPGFLLPEEELRAHKEKTYFHLRISEVVREHSCNASLIVMTLPVVRKGQVPPLLYMAWLDILTRGLPPTLMVRGNQESVLTFYS